MTDGQRLEELETLKAITEAVSKAKLHQTGGARAILDRCRVQATSCSRCCKTSTSISVMALRLRLGNAYANAYANAYENAYAVQPSP